MQHLHVATIMTVNGCARGESEKEVPRVGLTAASGSFEKLGRNSLKRARDFLRRRRSRPLSLSLSIPTDEDRAIEKNHQMVVTGDSVNARRIRVLRGTRSRSR